MSTVTDQRRGRIARDYRSKATQWLRAHPGPHPKVTVARECAIPQGSIGRVFKDPVFLTHRDGAVSLNTGATRNNTCQTRRYGNHVLEKVRHAVFAELSLKQPQTVDQLWRQLKFDRALIEEALEWARFEKTLSGYVIGLKRAEERTAE